jgi:hypothetical protein
MYTAAFCFIILIPCFSSGIEIAQGTMQSEKPLSFVTDGLKFAASEYSISGGSEWAYASYINDTFIVMNGTSFAINSEDSNLFVTCVYPSSGEGLWFITLSTDTTSAKLPLCAQTSAKNIDRTRDFLERYQNWTGNSSLTVLKNMLDSVDASKNTTISTNNITLTIASSPYFTSFYWEYTIKGMDYRGLGITIAEKYVFFRDDRNLPFLPQKPPETIFNSYYPSGLGIISPDENSTNVPLNTNITLFTTRPVGMMELYLNPEAKIANLTSETVQYSGRYTYRLAEPLQPNTKYTATVLYGQATPPDFDSAPMSMKSWSFTTGDSIEAGQPSSPESCYPSPFPWAALSAVIAGAGIAIVITGYLILRKKRQSKPPKSNS